MNAIVQPYATLDAHAQPLGREQRALEAHAGTPVTLTATVDGPLDIARLERALAGVAARHPATCLAFGRVDGLRGLRQHFGAGDDLPALGYHVRTPAPTRTALTLTAHALAIDGPSLRTLMRELALAYANDAAPADAPPLSYADYLDWTAGLAQENIDAGRDYWHALRDRLASLDAPRLPWRQQPGDATALQPIPVALGAEEAATIAGWAATFHVPPAHVLQAAWWLLLARLDPAAPFCAGWVNDCRDDFEALAGAVGRYTSVLPVTVAPDPARPFADWLAAFGGQLQQHMDWREHAPADIATAAASRYVFAVTAADPAHVAGWHIGCPALLLPGTTLALEIQTHGSDQPQTLVLHHDASFRADDVACLLDQYRTLLHTLRAQPDTAVGALPLATAADRARATALHAPAQDFGTASLPQRLARWAAERPQAAALSADGRTWTYAELAARVDAIATQLPALGLRPGQPAALALPRSGELVIALLAVMRAGAAYLPLDPAWPAQRRAQIAADAGATCLIEPADMAALMAAPDAPAALPLLDLAATAYVLYTSGSTGTPKGVPITHGQLLNYVAAVGHALRLDACRRFALTSTVAADLGNTTLFGALWHGACLCVANDADMQHPASFGAFLARERVDCLKIVPSHLDALLDASGDPLPLPTDAVVVIGGEAASPAFLAHLRAQAPGARLCNHYGPTETTVGILVHDAGPVADLSGQPLPLTRVLANGVAEIRTAAGHLATAGETGELYLGGAQLCAGYLGGAHADAFVSDPEHPGQRLYRSGDLARYLPHGGIELVGRADSQVKVRGFRIECGEIEQVLAALPGVRHAVVLPLAAADGTTQLAAWLVPADPAQPVTAAQRGALKQALAERLPDAMIPTQWSVIDALPRLPNGKVDRRALAQGAVAAQPAAGEPAREPATALEALLLDQMRDLLGSGQLGVTDDLFEAGGHSLLVIKLVARVRKLLKLDIAPAVVFDAPSAAALASALQAASPDPTALETLAGLQRQLAAMSPEARAALRASATA